MPNGDWFMSLVTSLIAFRNLRFNNLPLTSYMGEISLEFILLSFGRCKGVESPVSPEYRRGTDSNKTRGFLQ